MSFQSLLLTMALTLYLVPVCHMMEPHCSSRRGYQNYLENSILCVSNEISFFIIICVYICNTHVLRGGGNIFISAK